MAPLWQSVPISCSGNRTKTVAVLYQSLLREPQSNGSQVTSQPQRTWSLVLEDEPEQSELCSLGAGQRAMLYNFVDKVGCLSNPNLAEARKAPGELLVPIPWWKLGNIGSADSEGTQNIRANHLCGQREGQAIKRQDEAPVHTLFQSVLLPDGAAMGGWAFLCQPRQPGCSSGEAPYSSVSKLWQLTLKASIIQYFGYICVTHFSPPNFYLSWCLSCVIY